jgi:hypothetical protein
MKPGGHPVCVRWTSNSHDIHQNDSHDATCCWFMFLTPNEQSVMEPFERATKQSKSALINRKQSIFDSFSSLSLDNRSRREGQACHATECVPCSVPRHTLIIGTLPRALTAMKASCFAIMSFSTSLLSFHFGHLPCLRLSKLTVLPRHFPESRFPTGIRANRVWSHDQGSRYALRCSRRAQAT